MCAHVGQDIGRGQAKGQAKFILNGTDTGYVGSVTLTGHILNQFAMDEYDGVLRVASTLPQPYWK